MSARGVNWPRRLVQPLGRAIVLGAIILPAFFLAPASVSTAGTLSSGSRSDTSAALTPVRPPRWFRGSSCAARSELWTENQRTANLLARLPATRDYAHVYIAVVIKNSGMQAVMESAEVHHIDLNTPGPAKGPQLKPLHQDVYTRAAQTILDADLALGNAAAQANNTSYKGSPKTLADYRLARLDTAGAWSLLKQFACLPPLPVRVWVQPGRIRPNSYPTIFARSIVGAYCLPRITYTDGAQPAPEAFDAEEWQVDRSRTVQWTWHETHSHVRGTVEVGCTDRGALGDATAGFTVT